MFVKFIRVTAGTKFILYNKGEASLSLIKILKHNAKTLGILTSQVNPASFQVHNLICECVGNVNILPTVPPPPQ